MKKKEGIIRTSIIIGGITLFLIVLIILFLPKERRDLVSIVSISGALFSFAGVVIAIIQISRIESTTEVASRAATESRHDLQKVLSITEFAEIVSIVRKVKSFVRDDKYELAVERISDIKDFLDKVEFLGTQVIDANNLSRFKNKLDMNMDSLEKQYNKKGVLDKEGFMKDMEGLISLLNRVDNQMKQS